MVRPRHRWTHLALLRGVNVGGNNILRMSELQACLMKNGLADVRTYIQSGNVLFASAAATSDAELELQIEAAVKKQFGYATAVVVCSRKALHDVVHRAPAAFGSDAAYRYYVLFCKRPLTARQVLAAVTPKPGVDSATAANGVLYFATLKAKATSSSLPRLIGTPVYKSITIRNWTTTKKLSDLLDSMPPDAAL